MSNPDIGPLDWRIAITDKTGRPTPEFQRRWNAQRGINAAGGTVTLGSGVPTGTPGDGAEYIDISTTPFTLYVGSTNTWHQVSPAAFTDLNDVPNSYSGADNKYVAVNSGATGLDFITGPVLANPTATAGPAAVDGSASTFMRSDAAPAVQLGTTSVPGLLQPDGTTITVTGGVITSVGGGGSGGTSIIFPTSPTAPAAADWTAVNSSGLAGAVSDLSSGRGVKFFLPSTSGLQQVNFTSNTFTPPATGDFSFSMCLASPSGLSGAWQLGLSVTDSTGLISCYGARNGSGLGPTAERFDYNNINSLNNTVSMAGVALPWFGPMWIQLARVGSDWVYTQSLDGETFEQGFTDSSPFVGATIDSVGWMMIANSSYQQSFSCFAFEHTP